MSILTCDRCGKEIDTDYVDVFEIGDGSVICGECFDGGFTSVSFIGLDGEITIDTDKKVCVTENKETN